nr:inactive tyrosine-protein kinase transmembrane receptor ROR1 isoform X2 [Ciona intestinalis]|eukprot:XP_026691215.1 inactive tyrosine-protein kinase transmembrane receptor ROR1 isoform X2 [Ciona intestinalis]
MNCARSVGCCLLICFLAFCGDCSASKTSQRKEVLRRIFRSVDLTPSISTTPSASSIDQPITPAPTEDPDMELNLMEDMVNQTLQSGGKAIFRCKVEGTPTDAVIFTWYKDGTELVDDPRFNIRTKSWGSLLKISDVYTADSGQYRCEASIRTGEWHSAYLTVSFEAPPDSGISHVDPEYVKGRCEQYTGFACSRFLQGQYVYLEFFQKQENVEQVVSTALQFLANLKDVSPSCSTYAPAAFCYYFFSPCKKNDLGDVIMADPQPLRLCQEDCDLLKHKTCKNEFFNQNADKFSPRVFETSDCSSLPRTTPTNDHCTTIGLPSVVNRQHMCYNGTGAKYRGTLSVASTGETCKNWPADMLFEYSYLAGGHNFCRNPGASLPSPWCYVDTALTKKEVCQVPKCNFEKGGADGGNGDLVMILIPAVSIPLLLGCVIIVFCVACRRKKKTNKNNKGTPMETRTLSAKKAKVPELSSNMVHVIGELGDGKFGKVFKAQILSNLHYCPNEPVSVKTLNDRSTPPQVQEFQREMETFSELQHANVACLKAVVTQPSLRCMVFEYTNGVDLHEYLVLHSPQADFAKPPSSASSHASSSIEHADFIRMAIQVASGMDYLTRNNFIHRDLSARNVLVCGNLDLKICNLGVIRDSYLSCYYRNPQGGQMLPIRWMAPESLKTWQFSDKSAVWSFGVLLWEMFSYGLQPYCGYSNHEVLDMISRRQLLTCPDQCPAKVYSLMHECWCGQPAQRPTFADLHSKLAGWEGTSTTRMTSQLAQGIHRQLTNVMKEGGGQYAPYAQQQQRPVMMNDPGINKPPQPYSASPTSGFLTSSPPGAPNTSPASRLYQSPGTASSSAHSAGFYNQQHPQYQPEHPYPQQNRYLNPPHPNQHYSSNQSRSSGSCASSEYNHPPHLRVLPSHQEQREPFQQSPLPYPPPQEAMNRRQESVNQHQFHHPEQQRVYGNIENTSHDDQSEDSALLSRSRPGSGVRPDRIPLSVYKDQSESYPPSSPDRMKPLLAPKPPAYNTVMEEMNKQTSHGDSRQHRRQGSGPHPGAQGIPPLPNDDSRARNTDSASGKATSCDSGLPCDDVDIDESADLSRPMLPPNGQSPSRIVGKTGPQSAGSSVSGSTQVTAETRISA